MKTWTCTTQLRGMQQGFHIYGVDHKDFYPGLRSLTLTNADYTPASQVDTVGGDNTLPAQ